jgi:hypothetical protein
VHVSHTGLKAEIANKRDTEAPTRFSRAALSSRRSDIASASMMLPF